MHRFKILVFSFGCLLFGLSGCGSGERSDLAGWTINEGGLELAQTLRQAETDEFYFGELHDIAVGPDNRMYVADGERGTVWVLRPDGSLVTMIGKRGDGPGEFRRGPTQVTLARDSLYVFDAYTRSFSVFGPDRAFARRVSLPSEDGRPAQLFVPEDPSGFAVAYVGWSSTDGPGRTVVARLTPTGTVSDTLLATPPRPLYVESMGERLREYPIPFRPSATYAMGPNGRIHYAWGDSLTVTAHPFDGRRPERLQVPFEPVPVTEEDRTRELEPIRKGGRVSPSVISERIPDTKPAVRHLLVDDAERVWFGRPTAHPDSMDWWVAHPDEKQVVTTTLPVPTAPGGILPLAIHDNRLYARLTTETGAPALVRYRVRRSK